MSDFDLPRPGGALAHRPLHFLFMADCSGSMEIDGKIQSLNQAIREAIPHMRKVADENPYAQVLVRSIKFSNGAQWHVAQPTPVAEFTWTDLSAGGVTDLGKALRMVAEEMKIPPMPSRALPPVLVLISDGEPTDDWGTGLRALMEQPWGKKAVRIAVAIGKDARLEVLQKFIGHNELKPLQANNPEALVNHIKWASTAVLKSVTDPASQTEQGTTSAGNIILPPLPDPVTAAGAVADATDVW
jgi:uncharacterized protein YegL